ncbi:MAG: DUF89 family protein [Candidatus Omnitrophica bacterium]|nr:DUF89 family protein [Candidatus Omnitrophota bacterium]
MKTYLDCIPCFFKQALDAARLTAANQPTQRKILDALSKEILNFPLEASPPQMGQILYRLVHTITNNNDPFDEIKRQSNKLALRLYPQLKQKVKQAKNKLLAAVELAIAGNIIDYGVKHCLDIGKEIDKIFVQEDRLIHKEDQAIFAYPAFEQALKKAKKILYIGDNAGEVVFDRVLIEQLKGKKVIYAVRESPIINDALVEDAVLCGMHKVARIISSGCAAPGTILKLCSDEFQRIYRQAQMVISKGQGNFEALGEERRPVFFLFRAKCPVVAKHLKCKIGAIILKLSAA